MKLLHISDLHLGISFLGEPLLEYQRAFCDFLAKTAVKRKVRAVLVSGDVFDRAVSSAEAIALYDDWITKLCLKHGIAVCMIAGNHDGAERLASCNALLRHAGFYVAGRLQSPLVPICLEEEGEAVEIYLLPYFQPEEARAVLENSEIRTMEQAMAELFAGIQKEGSIRRILLAHCFAAGGETSDSDRAALVGGASRVGAEVFSAFDYVALGHLHAPQKVGKNAYYSGTPLPYSFSEKNQRKHFLVLDTEDLSLREIPVQAPYCLREERGTLAELKKQAKEHPSQDYLRLEATDARIAKEDYEFFREAYPNLLLAYSSAYAPGEEAALSPEQVEQLSAEAILREFLQEQEGRSPSQAEVQWFLRAMEQAEKGALL